MKSSHTLLCLTFCTFSTCFSDSQGFGFVKNLDDLKIRNEGYSKYGFNALASRNIGNFRKIPDTRHKLYAQCNILIYSFIKSNTKHIEFSLRRCESLTYMDKLPTATIVICFYNEHYETLLRTIHSIFQRTPAHLLKEIILVDDYSDIGIVLHFF